MKERKQADMSMIDTLSQSLSLFPPSPSLQLSPSTVTEDKERARDVTIREKSLASSALWVFVPSNVGAVGRDIRPDPLPA